MEKTALIVGVGPGMGLSLSKAFGAAGYQVGMIARDHEKLKGFAAEVRAPKVAIAAADVYDPKTVVAAAHVIRKELGPITHLLYNATAYKMVDLFQESAASLSHDLNASAGSLLELVKELLPDLEAAHGAIYGTGGGLALHPYSGAGSLSIGKAAIRSLIKQLHDSLAPKNVFATTLTIGGMIQHGDPVFDPDKLATRALELVEARHSWEVSV